MITTNSYHHYHKYSNLIKGREPCKVNEVWVSDITYIWLSESQKFGYLFLITDVYSRKIIGYCVHDTLQATGAVAALEMAISGSQSQGEGFKDCIHHSDRGVQYCCDRYTELLTENELCISMTEDSEPTDNAIAERVNRTLKEEFTTEKEMYFQTLKKAKTQMKKIIAFYNQERPHSSVSWLTPEEAYCNSGVALKRYWKNYRKKRSGDLSRHEALK